MNEKIILMLVGMNVLHVDVQLDIDQIWKIINVKDVDKESCGNRFTVSFGEYINKKGEMWLKEVIKIFKQIQINHLWDLLVLKANYQVLMI